MSQPKCSAAMPDGIKMTEASRQKALLKKKKKIKKCILEARNKHKMTGRETWWRRKTVCRE